MRSSISEPGSRRAYRGLISSLVAIPAVISLVACTNTPPAAPSQPTIQAAATQVSGAVSPIAATAQAAVPTIQAAASPIAATAQAAAPTVQAAGGSLVGTAVAAASPIATALAAPSPSPSPSPAAEAPAPVRITDASLADATPWVSLQNTGNAPVDVGGWRLEVGNRSANLPEGAAIEPGSTLTLHAGDGQGDDREVYLGAAGETLATAAQPGALVRLTDDSGRIVAQTTVPRFQ